MIPQSAGFIRRDNERAVNAVSFERPVIPDFDDLDSSKSGKRDCAPAAKRGCLSVIGHDH